MAASRRLMKELEEIRKCRMKNFHNIQVDEANLLTCQGLIVLDSPPYGKGAFSIKINFPVEHPFKPSKIIFKTKIYHPNIDDKGQVCLPVISAENWKPATKTDQVIQSLMARGNNLQPEHPLQADLAEEYSKDCKMFFKNTEEFTNKWGKATYGLKSATIDSSKCEQSPRAVHQTPHKAGLWKIDTCYRLAFTCGSY